MAEIARENEKLGGRPKGEWNESDEAGWQVMAIYRPLYKDKKTGQMKHTKTWYFEFMFAGRLIKESAKSTSKTVAREAEKQSRDRVPNIKALREFVRLEL